jgi:hypothetical protein
MSVPPVAGNNSERGRAQSPARLSGPRARFPSVTPPRRRLRIVKVPFLDQAVTPPALQRLLGGVLLLAKFLWV